MSDHVAGGPGLPQERRLVTAIPGPRSRDLQARKSSAVAEGVGTAMPVFARGRRRRLVEDVDGNSLIDLGSGIAVTTVGSSAPAGGGRGHRSRSQAFTHTCFMVTPYEGYVAVAEALNELTPGATRSAPRCSTPAPRRSRTP